jgi:ABC-2 type transport system permease protein
MTNIVKIIKHEILTTLGKRSFWIVTFFFPILVMGLSVGMQTVGKKAIEDAEEAASSIEEAAAGLPIGFIDDAGVLETVPDWLPEGYLIEYPDRETANEDLDGGKINQYYFIPDDFFTTGKIILIDRNFQPLRSSSNAEIFENILMGSMIEKDPLGQFINNPTTNINSHALKPPSGPDQDDPLTTIVPMATLFIFFFVITSSSGFLLSSVTKEKENRTAEILLVSLDPKEIMTGKIFGLGVVALFQMTVWLGGAIIALNQSSQFLASGSNFNLPPGFFIWAISFFIGGYFLYGSILGAIGVLTPNAREGGQFTFIAILPLLIPLWFNYSFTDSPNGPLSVALSLFPLSAPSSMISRLTTGIVPLWQIILSLIGLAMTAYFFVLFASRLFKADNFLSMDSLSWKRFRTAISRKRKI